ncbi:Roundabout 3 [Orchesella cincta]|uniref:Roundabout 3 n=1 Tax=Orchesella cincta TaxID=48709 RepID=A0A1D2N3G6_ORCCI|nr:Roundabout 3 [Orchesella cincta]
MDVRPQFTIVPSNTSTLLGSDVSLACVARGDPPPEITWKRQRGTLPLKRAHFDEERFLISNVSIEDQGAYTCVAENKAGSVSSSAFISVLALPEFVVVPQNVEIQPNSTAYFGCEAVGSPMPTLFWSKEGSHSVIFQASGLENIRVTSEGTLQVPFYLNVCLIIRFYIQIQKK